MHSGLYRLVCVVDGKLSEFAVVRPAAELECFDLVASGRVLE